MGKVFVRGIAGGTGRGKMILANRMRTGMPQFCPRIASKM